MAKEKGSQIARNEFATSLDVHHHIQYWGYGLVLIVYTVAEYAQEWESLKYLMHPSLEVNKLMFISRLVLFIELVILIGRWIIATINEMDMWSSSKLNWNQWSSSFVSKQNTYSAILSLAVFIGLLLAFIDDIMVMSIIFTIYIAVNIWTQSLCLKYFKQAFSATKPVSPKHKKILDIMEHYWITRPQIKRLITMLITSLVGVCFVVISILLPVDKEFYELCAYAVLILEILISEIVITNWRHKRDRDLEMNRFG